MWGTARKFDVHLDTGKPTGRVKCTAEHEIEPTPTYAPDATGYQSTACWWQVPEAAVIRNAGNPLGEAVVWYASLRGNIVIRCFVPADAS